MARVKGELKLISKYASMVATQAEQVLKAQNDLLDELNYYELLGVSSSREIDIDKLRSSTDITKSMSVPIGKNDEGDIICLDLHHKGDGPNSIIVGPSGSGKSEFIETVLLALALFFSEDEVIFNMIDNM